MRGDGLPLRKIAALIAYDGTDFCGFQVQRQQPTVQGALEDALTGLTGTFCRVAGAGRTDTGVHARGQVVSVQVPWKHPLNALQRAWNHHLPNSIVIRRVVAAPPEFHPRFSATDRTYRYTVWVPGEGERQNRKFPLLDRFAWVLSQRPDVSAMNRAAVQLLGSHDFATFGQAPQGENTVRHISLLQWQKVEETLPALEPAPFERLVLTVTANGFLRRMMRNLVGSLLAVGTGAWQSGDLTVAWLAKDRSRSAPPAPANGLVLERVRYADFPNLFIENEPP